MNELLEMAKIRNVARSLKTFLANTGQAYGRYYVAVYRRDDVGTMLDEPKTDRWHFFAKWEDACAARQIVLSELGYAEFDAEIIEFNGNEITEIC